MRDESTDDVPTVNSSKLKPEEDLGLLGMLEDSNIKTTLFVCGITARLFPDRLKELAKSGFEIAAHGYRHENFQLLNRLEQKRRIGLSLNLLKECVGREVLGWRSPGLHASTSFYRLLEDSNVQYCSNVELPLCFKHVPFRYCHKVELPIGIIDLKLYQSRLSPAKVRRRLLSTLSQRHEIVNVVIHPWVQLQDAERVRVLKDFLEAAESMDGVTFSSGSEVCQQSLLRGISPYDATLSVFANVWKRVSRRMQGPSSKVQAILGHA